MPCFWGISNKKMGILICTFKVCNSLRKDHMAAEFWNIKKFHAALSSGEPFLVDFFATWCGPCKQMAPIFEEFAVLHDEVHAAKVDIDAEPALAELCGVRSVPTFILFRNGKEFSRALGAMPLRKLEQFAGVKQSAKEKAEAFD